MVGVEVTAIFMTKIAFSLKNFFLRLKVESQIDQLQKDSLGKSYERTLF